MSGNVPTVYGIPLTLSPSKGERNAVFKRLGAARPARQCVAATDTTFGCTRRAKSSYFIFTV